MASNRTTRGHTEVGGSAGGFAGGFGAVLLLMLAVLFVGPAGAAVQTVSYVDLDQHTKYDDFAAGSKNGVKVVKLANGDGWVRLANPRSATDTTGFYNGGRYYRGTLTSPVYETSTRFDTLVGSWKIGRAHV